MTSRIKRAHRTHALAQPAGEAYPHPDSEGATHGSGDARLFALFSELCARVPDADERAKMLGVSPAIEAAWERGAALPMLRAHRKVLERTVRGSLTPP